MLTIILIVATVVAIGIFYLMVIGSGEKPGRGKRTFFFKPGRGRASGQD